MPSNAPVASRADRIQRIVVMFLMLIMAVETGDAA